MTTMNLKVRAQILAEWSTQSTEWQCRLKHGSFSWTRLQVLGGKKSTLALEEDNASARVRAESSGNARPNLAAGSALRESESDQGPATKTVVSFRFVSRNVFDASTLLAVV